MSGTRKVIVGISGASGAILGVRLLQALRAGGQAQTHLIVSDSGALTAAHELGLKRGEIEALADVCYKVRDIGAAVASGSFLTAGMIVAPCSMKTLASIAHGLADNLIARAADVVLKERRRLVLVARETPLNLAHLRNMCSVTEMGGIVMPPVPAFYAHPRSVDDIVDHSVGRVLDLLGFEHDRIGRRWEGLRQDRVRECEE
jgi:2,5-furandicarboxylate decarboxylase 2